MRDYGKVSPLFWTGKTGKGLRGAMEAQIVALYLMTSPHSSMIGVFHLPLMYVAHETGLTLEGASKGLARCSEAQFCTYDEETETIFVHEMAAHQVGAELKDNDKRLISVRKQYAAMAEGRIKSAFQARYGDAYGLPKPEKKGKGVARGSEAPPKPEAGTGAGTEKKKAPPQPPASVGPVELQTWIAGLGEQQAIPADDSIFDYAEKAGIPLDFLALSWDRFVQDMTERKTRKKDWRAHYRNAVRGNWFKLWWFDPATGDCRLTTTGEQARRAA